MLAQPVTCDTALPCIENVKQLTMNTDVFRRLHAAPPMRDTRFVFQQVSPFARSLCIEALECGNGHAFIRMKASPRTARSAADPRPDPAALIGLLDHSVGYALAGILDTGIGMSTFDMRFDFAHHQPVAGDIIGEASMVLMDKYSTSIQCAATDATGTTVANCTALFRLGGFPGDVAPDPKAMGNYNPDTRKGPFSNTLGLVREHGALSLQPNNMAVIGWESGMALHGGAIGALLMAACRNEADISGETASGKRLASLYLRFIRPGSGALNLHASSSIERKGRAASFIVANCFHAQGKEVATAHATFVQCER